MQQSMAPSDGSNSFRTSGAAEHAVDEGSVYSHAPLSFFHSGRLWSADDHFDGHPQEVDPWGDTICKCCGWEEAYEIRGPFDWAPVRRSWQRNAYLFPRAHFCQMCRAGAELQVIAAWFRACSPEACRCRILLCFSRSPLADSRDVCNLIIEFAQCSDEMFVCTMLQKFQAKLRQLHSAVLCARRSCRGRSAFP